VLPVRVIAMFFPAVPFCTVVIVFPSPTIVLVLTTSSAFIVDVSVLVSPVIVIFCIAPVADAAVP
jgi:hypothetical protein